METEIEINGEKYVKKKSFEGGEVKRFSITDTIKIMKLLKSIISEDEGISEELAVEKGVTICDPANVVLVKGLSEESKRVLAHFKNSEETERELPEFNFKTEKTVKGRYSMEYLTKILPILELTGDSVKVKMAHDYPIELSNNHFLFILAPRIESEDDEDNN